MADQIEGLPEGAVVRPLQAQEETAPPQSVGEKSSIEGLPEGATVRPLSTPSTMGGAGGSWEEPSTASKVWEKATTPLLSQPLIEKRATEYSTAAPTLSESEHPYRTAAKKFGAGVVGSTEKMARDFSSPLGVATMAAGPIVEGAAEAVPALKGLAEASPYIKPAMKYGQRAMGTLFGAQGAVEAGKGVKQAYEEGGFTPETAEQTLGGAGIAAMGGAGALEGTKIGQERAGKVMSAPVRGAAKAATIAQPVIPTLTGSVLGGLAGEAAGHPMLGMMAGGAVGRKLIPKDLGESFLEKGRTLGLNDKEAKIAHLQERYNKALKDAKAPADEYAAHEPGRQRGIPAPEDVMKAHEKAQTALQAAKAHLDAAKEDYEDSKGVPPSTGPIELSPEQKLAQDTRQAPSPTDEDIKVRQERLMGDIEKRVGIEPEVPAAPKPEPPPIMTAGAPERAPSMKGLKVDEATGKVIDTTATEDAAREALGAEAPGRKVPATEGVAMRPPFAKAPAEESPLAKYAPEEIAKREAVKAEAPKEAPKPAEVPAVEAPKAEAPKEAPERSPEDVGKAEKVVYQLPNQELQNLGNRFGISTKTEDYDFSKREATREGGSKHAVDRDRFHKDLMARLPTALVDKLVDAEAAWDKANPQTFDEPSRSSKFWADRSKEIVKDALTKYQDDLAAKGAAGGSGAPDEGIGGLERWQGKNPLDKATVKPTADKVNLPADTGKEQPFEAGNQTWEDQLREARKTVNQSKMSPEDRAKVQEALAKQGATGGAPYDVRTQVGAHNSNGGSTFHPEHGDLNGKPFFAVGGEPEFRAPELKMTTKGGELTEAQIKEFTERPAVKEALAKHPDASIGTWHDKEADQTVTELVKTPANRDEALKMGVKNDQKAIYDLKEGKEVPTGGTGEPKGGNITLHHWSDVDGLKETDPDKFGTGKAGAEKARAKEEGFLPRTYFADAEYKESAIQGQKNHYTAEVDPEKYYDIAKDPDGIWQKALKDGGATAAEKAVHDAGYHGYFHDGGYVSFEKVPVKPYLGELAEKHGTPEEKAGITKSKAQTEKFVSQMEKIPEVHEYVDIALAGEGARKWYQRSAQAFEAMSSEAPEYFKEEGDKDKFINLLAASSPRQPVAMNLRETLRTWKAYVDAGRPEGDTLKSLLDENLSPAVSKTPNALKALTGQEMWPDITKNKNFKVPSFARNLRGWLGAVTNDGWMSLFAGLDPREISSAHSYHPLSIATRAAAEELGWEPAEAQAAIWSFTQALTERGEELPEEVRKHSEDFVDLLAHDPYTRELLADLGVTHANLDAKLAAIGEKPEVSGRETPTTARSVERLKERIETARGKGTIPPPKSAQGELGFREAPAQGNRARVEDEDTSFNTAKLENEVAEKPKGSPKHTYEYKRDADSHQVTVRDKDGKSVALIEARAADDNPNKWTVKTSASAEKGEGLKGYTRLMDAAQSQAERSGKPVTVQGDTEMSSAAVRTWVKLGRDYDVAWHRDNRPSITFRPSKMKY